LFFLSEKITNRDISNRYLTLFCTKKKRYPTLLIIRLKVSYMIGVYERIFVERD
jgi:hypothetical protein